MFNLKSIPLTDEDLLQISEAIYDLDDEEVDELREQNRDEGELTDAEMRTYVWDYSAYPECVGQTEETAAEQDAVPQETASEKN